ncbi:MAG: hypothetical protein ABI300_06615 [Rhodanobacter sp.]
MDAFSYLSVLLSIILGLAITQVLQGFRGLMLARDRVQGYWPCLAWAILLLVIDVQVWWAMYELRFVHEWRFVYFAVVLLQTIPLYLLSGLVMPDIHGDGRVDLRKHYYANHRWFFILLGLLLLVSILKDLVLYRHLPPALNTGFHLLFIAASVAGAWTSREWLHKALVPFSAVTVAVYISILFAHLH